MKFDLIPIMVLILDYLYELSGTHKWDIWTLCSWVEDAKQKEKKA